MILFRVLPHPHLWLVTRWNPFNLSPSEQSCFLCDAYRHRAYWDKPWAPGRFPV